ncbi:SDR family oxidoreductase [Aggregatimonas sangjinii]|uniref:SDR family oxidoreductase n=1 Tax=Aggregatimonas sangjinii TaxID=2583587 RepID=A0A5B7SSK4_9FLAO|nr:SDR family oxidoreductase [Aggregatimonas sangjinii]QCX01507.1 SDR family oxidoreductase [Aggregatimonas sangjinii]
MNKSIAILGCGWLGLPLAMSLLNKGFSVRGSTTSEKKLELLQAKGIAPYLISISENSIDGNISDFLTDVSVLIINIPPGLRGSSSENFVRKMKLLHSKIKRSDVKRLIFVSSTSVYGDLQGEVTEQTPPEPVTESGRQLLEAENIFRADDNLDTTIVRFGGLIGDDRHPITMLSGRTGLTNGSAYINLIHQNDCIKILEHVITAQWWNQILNGVYPYHPSKNAYYTSEARKRGLKPPQYEVENTQIGKKIVPFALLNVKGFSFNTSIRS